MSSKKPTTAQHIVALEKLVDDLRAQVFHLEVLQRLQEMPVFLDMYIVNYEGPKVLNAADINGSTNCYFCGNSIVEGDLGYELITRHHIEMLEGKIINRRALIPWIV